MGRNEEMMIRSRHDNKQSAKQAKIMVIGQMCVAVEAPANRPGNDHDYGVSGMP